MDIFESLKNIPFDIQEHNPSLRKWGIGFPHTEETKQHIREMKTGLKQTVEHIQKRVSKTRGFKQSQYQKDRARETLECSWLITDPQGQQFNIVNLRKFCRDNNLDQGNLSRGKYKGWKALKIGP